MPGNGIQEESELTLKGRVVFCALFIFPLKSAPSALVTPFVPQPFAGNHLAAYKSHLITLISPALILVLLLEKMVYFYHFLAWCLG